MTNSEHRDKQVCRLPSNNKKVQTSKMNFEKTVRLTSFQKPQLQSVLPFLFAVLIVISYQGRGQTSEQDEASFKRRRRDPLGGLGACTPQKILKPRGSEMLL